ncbi:MAG: DNA polymerase I [Candidatus Ryanbacteria bacterium RIFCSPHIGHO2_02_FULL_48_12]|uniref:DNA polymerase I n=1 Tax=Candidatus Ryanbacteria bacterium RIFCSPHIGHO2_01_FULL_48_27 TaxID=1802115 RepID=A0A1G2G7M4_9BACT|nr:MAG: DNA polymerase I [Candidatus Ryanbacteria bacterium RIFCSPHIGHO2_01_FULL_48_27]OGZ49169.1 MAG: DNA polymerase I [Candidatus Ryanbacteria bacterium RIFCSPHIGHO2_02_FULL_48_12]
MKDKEAKKENVFVILDAHALIHRAFHALPPFTSPQGEPVGAVYGVASVLFKIAREFNPKYIAAAFDRPEPTFRHKAYKEYKATRAEISPDIIPQFAKVQELFRAFDVAVYERAGYEADDIIGTLTDLIKKEKEPIRIIIASGDLDAVQLVDGDRVRVYTLKKGINDTIIYDQKAVEDRFGFAPAQLIDYKGLRGDASDNIKGVPGIGEKTATLLIQTYGPLESIYAHLDEIRKDKRFRGNVAGVLEAHKDEAFFSRDLATIRRDAPMDFHLKDSLWDTYDRTQVVRFLQGLNFTSLINRLPVNGGASGESSAHTPDLFSQNDTPSEERKDHAVLAGDVADVLTRAGKCPAIGMVLDEEDRLYVGYKKEYCVIEASDIAAHQKALEVLFASKKVKKTAFEAKRILKYLWRAGVAIENFDIDVGVAAWVVDPSIRAPHLAGLIREALDVVLSADAWGEMAQHIAVLAGHLEADLKRTKLTKIFRDIEIPLVPVLARMEEVGIALDERVLVDFSKELGRSLASHEQKIYKLAGSEFNINSPKQLAEVLFKNLEIDTKGIRKTDGGERSTKASELAKLAKEYPLAAEVMRYREETKLKSTYVDVLPTLADPCTHRIHTTFNQTGAVTGRLSSQDPNMQNIPIRTPLGQNIRKAFVAGPGNELVSFDYSQVELRIAASLAGDKKMIKAFADGADIHTMTAAEVNGVPEDQVTPTMRRAAKTINFGILYGMGAVSLAESLGITRAEASHFIARYFAQFPKIKGLIDDMKRQAHKHGYVETIFGRRRYFQNIQAMGWQARAEAERMAVNAPIQGSGADIIKIAMVRIADDIVYAPDAKEVRMILQVHDELLFEMPKDSIQAFAPKIKHIMESVVRLKVHLRVDAKAGLNWQEMRPLGL